MIPSQQTALRQLARSLERVDAASLVAQFGTPTFVDDLAEIETAVDRLEHALRPLPRSRFLYSLKPNPAPPILRLLASRGLTFDACSAFDLHLLERLGLLDERASFCTHSLDSVDLDAVVDSGVHVVADSGSQLERYRAAGVPGPFGLRVNVGVDAGFHPHVQAGAEGSRFGIDHGEIVDLCADLRETVTGLHCHIGSDVEQPEHHLLALDRLLALAEEIPAVDYVNLGGGLPVPFTDDDQYDLDQLGRGVAQRLEAFQRSTGRSLEFRIEPGGYLSRRSGVLLVSVNEVRRVDGRQVVLTNGNINTLPGALLYDAVHPILVLGGESDGHERSTVVGNLMQPGDIMRRDVILPEVRPGDVLAFGLVGAYCLVRGTTFNGRPLPAEVSVAADGSTDVVRARQTVDELVDALMPLTT